VNVQAKALADVVARVTLSWSLPPKKALEGKTLLEVGLLAVLARNLTVPQAEKSLVALRNAFPDWNELRISQIQEFQGLLKGKNQKVVRIVARDVKDYLQEIFQNNHGFDLEALRSDPTEASKFLTQLPFLGASAAHLMIYSVDPSVVPLSGGIVRVLDRMGLMKRTSSLRKGHAMLEKAVAPDVRIGFGARLGLVVEKWCDSKKPMCWECPLLDGCPFGARVFRDWQASQKRLEISRQRDELRRIKEEERLRKRADIEEKRRRLIAEREASKRRREEERREAIEEKKRQVIAEKKAKVEAKKKAVLAKKAASKRAAAKKVAAKKAAVQKAAAAKKAAAQKAAAAKKAAAKKALADRKAAAQKAAVSKKKAAQKKAATKKPAAKPAKRPVAAAPKKKPKVQAKKAGKVPPKKAAAKKPAAKKPVAKKPVAKKAAAKKAAAKPVAQKAPAQKAPTKKAPTKKAPTKKAPAKKAPTKKVSGKPKPGTRKR